MAVGGRGDFGEFAADAMSEKTDPKIQGVLGRLFSTLKHRYWCCVFAVVVVVLGRGFFVLC